MITIQKIGVAQAQTYYREHYLSPTALYYQNGQTLSGVWQGKLAQEWGLVGAVTDEQFERVTAGCDPWTGALLVAPRPGAKEERPAWETQPAAWAEYLEAKHIEAIDKRPDELSGGMRQRVAVARALAMRPKVLLMDEPFAALDVQTRAKMQDFLSDVWRDSGASVLFVTHHIDEAVALADRVVVFTARPGQIKRIIAIDLPRPRDLFAPETERLRRELTELLRDEVERAFAEQEHFAAS